MGTFFYSTAHPLTKKGYKRISEEEALVLASLGVEVCFDCFDVKPFAGVVWKRTCCADEIRCRMGHGYVFLVEHKCND